MHQRHRLGIFTITAEAELADFGYLREALRLTPGNLSRHLTVLEEAGLIQVKKGYEGRRPRTWVQITAWAAPRSQPSWPRSPNCCAGTQRVSGPDKETSDCDAPQRRRGPRTQNNHPVHLHQFACRSQPA